MKTGQAEKRDLTVTGTSSITLPVSFQPQVYEALKSWGEIYNLVNVLRLPHSEPRKLVLSNDTSNGWANVSVGSDISDVDPTLSGITLSTDVISTSLVKIGVDMLNDSGFDVEGWVKGELGKRYARGTAAAIVNGGGPTGQVQGIVAGMSASANVTSTYTGNVQYVDILNLFTTLDPAYQDGAVFAMNNHTIFQIASLTDTNGRPLWLPNYGSLQGEVGSYQGGQFFGSILGKPVKLVTQLPNAGSGNMPILFGDFKAGYTFREPENGIDIMRLNERYAPSYEVGFLGFSKVGGVVTDAGTHPFIGLWHN
jgi:HK97 family phage major capsid protein